MGEFGTLSQKRVLVVRQTQCLMGLCGRSLDDNNVERKADTGGSAHVFSEGSVDSAKIWAKGHSRDVSAKNLPSFCPCSENLSEAKLKDNELICLGAYILR